MGTFRFTLVVIGFIFCQGAFSQSLPKIPTDGQTCLVFQILQSQKKTIEKFFEKQKENSKDSSCFALSSNYLTSKIYYPESNETFKKTYFGSTQNINDSIHKIDSLVQKFTDTVQVKSPGYAYCRCKSGIGCFDVKLSPIFKGVFSAEIRLRDYNPWKHKVSERKFIFTFMTEKDGDIIGYMPIH